jgi:hypothetical protein
MTDALIIRRLGLTVLARRDHPEPEQLRGRIAEAVQGSLPAALRDALGGWNGDGVLRIRRLEVDLTVDTTLSPDHIAARLTEAIAKGVRRARTDGARVLSYRDRSRFLADFLRDLAAGRAWERWWFASFDGLRMLPVSAAIRTAVLAEPSEGLAALLTLSPPALAHVLGKLTASDAARLLAGFAALGADDIPVERSVTALAVAPAEAGSFSALAIYLEAVRIDRDCAGRQLAALASALAALDHLLAERPGEPAVTLLRRLQRRGKYAITKATAALAPMLLLAAKLRRPLIGRAATRRGIAAARIGSSIGAAVDRRTTFGGLFILLASLDVAAIAAAAADAREEDDLPAASLIGLATLAACAGRAQAADVLADPIWREAFGLQPSFGAADVSAALAAIAPAVWTVLDTIADPIATRADARFLLSPRATAGGRAAAHTIARLARATLTRFARRLPGFAASSAGFLYRNVLAVSAAVETTPEGFSVTLERAPLDVLLSISGIADAVVAGPCGQRIRLRRRSLP